MKAVNRKTEHLVNPLGIDSKRPYLTWNCEGGMWQTAYEVEAVCGGVTPGNGGELPGNGGEFPGNGREAPGNGGELPGNGGELPGNGGEVPTRDGEGETHRNSSVLWASEKVETSDMHAVCGFEPGSRQHILWRVRLWDENGQCGEWSDYASFEMGLLEKSDWQAKWINPELTCDPAVHKPASYLRTSFTAPDTFGRARLYVTAHGLYEAALNGKRAGDFVLAPGTYNYDEHIAYQTIDVTELVTPGENEVSVILGDGWYRSVSGVDGDRNLYGEDVALLFQLEIDGTVVCISDEHWQASQSGEIRENDMQQGEVVDARMAEIKDYHEVKLLEEPKHRLVCSNALPICEMERFHGKVITTPNGETVIDYGQNMAGYIEFELEAKAGQKIVLTHGEVLDENGNFTQENFQDRQRHKEGGTHQRVTYTCKEGKNHYKTKFSIFGFRYAKVETDIDLRDAQFTAIAAYSKMERLGTFTCSDERVNQLVENSIWSQKSNFCDVPTDCPTRERAAWTGDIGAFIGTGLTLMDSYTVVRKWLEECRLAQYPDGKIANIAPRNNNPSFFAGLLAGSVGWGDAVIIVPYHMYRRYGDIRILEENYGMMKKWYAFLEKRAGKRPMNPVKWLKRNPYRRFTIETGIDYGEWCEPDVESTSAMRTPQGKVATAYLASSGKMLSEIAEILGRKEDADHFSSVSEGAKKAFRFIATEDGKIHSDRQAEYVRAVALGLLEKKEAEAAAKDLDELVQKNGYHLNTGFLSTPDLCRVLADYGYADTAYKLLLQDDMPGWLYAVKKGATTIWEMWDGVDGEGHVKASHNHYSYGAICGWLFDGVCGIHVSDGEIIIKPIPNEAFNFARASYESPYGLVESGWRRDGDQYIFEGKIPANVRAKLVLPDRETELAGEFRITVEYTRRQ